MRNTTKWIVRSLYSLAVVGAMTFGATQLFAGGAADCTSQGMLGTCPPFTDTTCNDACKQTYGEWSMGRCFGNCCVCTI